MIDVGAPDPAARSQLENERDFLLRSLDDLERERDKGAIDDESYTRLHDEYTARAAAVLRALQEGIDDRPAAPPVSRRRRVLTIAGVGAFLVLAVTVLVLGLNDRLPGQTSSGNTGPAEGGAVGRVSAAERRQRLERAVQANPDDLASRLLLARYLEADGDSVGALEQYDAVLVRNPQSAEAEAHAGRILYLTARAAVKSTPEEVDGLVEQSRARLDHAVAIDPTFPDARYFRAIVLANEYGDFATAQSDLQRYLVVAPQGMFADRVRQLLAEVTAVLEGTSRPTSPTTPSTSTPNTSTRSRG